MQENSTYLIKLNINNKKKLKYKFSSFDDACTFFYLNLRSIVQANVNKKYAYYNACLFFVKDNEYDLLIRKNLTKVTF